MPLHQRCLGGKRKEVQGFLGVENWDFTQKNNDCFCVCRFLFKLFCSELIWKPPLLGKDISSTVEKKRSVTFSQTKILAYLAIFQTNRSLRKVVKSWKLILKQWKKSGYVFKNWISLAMVHATLPCIKKLSCCFSVWGPLTKTAPPPPENKGNFSALSWETH